MKNKYVLLHQTKIGLLLRPNVSKLTYMKNKMFCYIKLKLAKGYCLGQI